MYGQDSFFTLSVPGQFGLAALTIVLSLAVSALVFRAVRGHRVAARGLMALVVFWVFVWASPQIYYAYYRVIIDGLPQQWVIGWPDMIEPLRYLTFTGPATLSAHGQGVLGWLLVLLAVLRR